MERVFLDVILKKGNKWIFMIFMSNSKLKVYEVLNAAVCAVTQFVFFLQHHKFILLSEKIHAAPFFFALFDFPVFLGLFEPNAFIYFTLLQARFMVESEAWLAVVIQPLVWNCTSAEPYSGCDLHVCSMICTSSAYFSLKAG